MKSKYVVGLLVFTLATPLFAAKKKPTPAPAPTMDPAMVEMMKFGAPSENHRVLDPVIGKWNAVVRGWMNPGAKVEESKGTADNSWVLGGRFVKQDFKGDWAGQPFEGTGYTGYDNVRQQYVSIWLDNFSTGIMQSSGGYDAPTKTVSLSGTFSCPMGKEKEKWVRSELRIIDNDNNVYTSYFKDAKGDEFKSMEIIYTRIK